MKMRLKNEYMNQYQPTVLTEDDADSALKVCDNEWRGMVLTGQNTGQRIYEVATLRWNQVDLESRKIRFVARKTGVVAECYIMEPLFEYLLSLPRPSFPDAPVFHRACKTAEKNPSALASEFRMMLEKAGAKPWSFHALRRTLIHRLVSLGTPLPVVCSIVGVVPRTWGR